ncbi:MAG: hypothetical protein CMM47_10680 [Rhodospirillaceae bacterium]|nr:hypothetical protein [Rhodospirillaceae bacterium]
MPQMYNVLMLGASYGSLLAAKLLLAGHNAKLVCLPAEVELINAEGAVVKMPIKGREGLVELKTIEMPGSMSAAGPADIDPSKFDLAVLAMQEPQYRSPDVRALLEAIAEANLPCMSIMNMPPLPYLKRIPGLDTNLCRESYADATVWDKFDPALMTLCSPDPQAFRPPEEKVNVLQVRLPTNFKSARFESDTHTAILNRLESDINAIRYDLGGEQVELPVKLRVHDSIFVPMAKWCMLLAGNYRCVMAEEMRSIRDAVHTNLDESKAVYNWVSDLCVSLGADPGDMVPFEKYADAAQSLVSPSSAARALAAGAPRIERVDRLVKSLAARKGKSLEAINNTVDLVDNWLEKNREKAL